MHIYHYCAQKTIIKSSGLVSIKMDEVLIHGMAESKVKIANQEDYNNFLERISEITNIPSRYLAIISISYHGEI